MKGPYNTWQLSDCGKNVCSHCWCYVPLIPEKTTEELLSEALAAFKEKPETLFKDELTEATRNEVLEDMERMKEMLDIIFMIEMINREDSTDS